MRRASEATWPTDRIQDFPMTQLAFKDEQLTRELLTCLEKLRDTYNKEGYTMAATQLDGLLDDYHAEREQQQENNK